MVPTQNSHPFQISIQKRANCLMMVFNIFWWNISWLWQYCYLITEDSFKCIVTIQKARWRTNCTAARYYVFKVWETVFFQDRFTSTRVGEMTMLVKWTVERGADMTGMNNLYCSKKNLTIVWFPIFIMHENSMTELATFLRISRELWTMLYTLCSQRSANLQT